MPPGRDINSLPPAPCTSCRTLMRFQDIGATLFGQSLCLDCTMIFKRINNLEYRVYLSLNRKTY